MATKKMAILRLTPQAFRDLMQLPETVEVVRVELESGTRGNLHLMIEGAGWDTHEGAMVIPAQAAIITSHKDQNGTSIDRIIDWGLPE